MMQMMLMATMTTTMTTTTSDSNSNYKQMDSGNEDKIHDDCIIIVPPGKKRKISNNTTDDQYEITSHHNEEEEEEEEEKEKEKNSLQHKFDVVNSHRYYCPFVCGFHQQNKQEIVNQINVVDVEVDVGSSNPCWEVVWKRFLQFLISSDNNKIGGSSMNYHPTTVEEKFNAIRKKIRSSIVVHVN